MFDKEFFPTPINVLQMMQIDCSNKIVLEPSAGKGDIVDFLNDNNASSVIAFEKNKDLNKVLQSKCNVIGDDFFSCKAEDISHIDMIVMNPPFSNADKHILYAWEIAPEGCEIISLCNYQTIDNDYSRQRTRLNSIIIDSGISQNLGDCFSDAERTTGIDIGLIKLYKPVVSDENSFDGFFMDEDEEVGGSDGVMQYDEIRALVNRYVGAIKVFDKLDKIKDELIYTTSVLGVSNINFTLGYNDTITNKNEFSKNLQKKSWNYIFKKLDMQKYVTSGVMKDINKFVEQQHNIPFTMKNVYKMLEIIVGTRQQTFNRALEEAIDNFTRYTHENRYDVEGWKTNSGYMLNKKIIVGYMVELSWVIGMSLKWGSNMDKINDLIKVLCNITAQDFNSIKTFRDFFNENTVETNTWYEVGFFEFKCFKKGTMHLKFKNDRDWYLLNQAYGKLKGFSLPEKTN